MTDETHEIDDETRKRIREQVLQKEKSQLHLDKVHNLIPQLVEIVENEVDEVEEVDHEHGGES